MNYKINSNYFQKTKLISNNMLENTHYNPHILQSNLKNFKTSYYRDIIKISLNNCIKI